MCVRTNLSSTIATAIFVRSSSNLVHGSYMSKRRLSSVDKFPGSVAPLLHPQNRFLGRTSSLSQWRAFQRLSWRPIKLCQNIKQIELYKKCKVWGQKGRGLSHVTYFKFRDPLNISVAARARNLKFGMQNDYKEFYQKMQNEGTKGAWPRSRDLLLNFGTP